MDVKSLYLPTLIPAQFSPFGLSTDLHSASDTMVGALENLFRTLGYYVSGPDHGLCRDTIFFFSFMGI